MVVLDTQHTLHDEQSNCGLRMDPTRRSNITINNSSSDNNTNNNSNSNNSTNSNHRSSNNNSNSEHNININNNNSNNNNSSKEHVSRTCAGCLFGLSVSVRSVNVNAKKA